MRTRSAAACLFAISLAFAPLAAAAQTRVPDAVAAQDGAVRFEPLSPWNIDFGENRCRLTRLFGAENDRHLVMFEQAAPGRAFGLTLAGGSLSSYRTAGKVDLGLERDEPMETKDRFEKGQIANLGPALIFSSIGISKAPEPGVPHAAGIDLGDAAKIDRVVLGRGKAVLSFETGNMQEPLGALNDCTFDLLSKWGLDPEAHRKHIPPVWTNQNAVTGRIVAVYPSAARSIGEQAIFRLRVTVETDGSVSDCLIEEATVTQRLESPACKEMRRAVFEPARDAEGKPMRSFYATTITYKIG